MITAHLCPLLRFCFRMKFDSDFFYVKNRSQEPLPLHFREGAWHTEEFLCRDLIDQKEYILHAKITYEWQTNFFLPKGLLPQIYILYAKFTTTPSFYTSFSFSNSRCWHQHLSLLGVFKKPEWFFQANIRCSAYVLPLMQLSKYPVIAGC